MKKSLNLMMLAMSSIGLTACGDDVPTLGGDGGATLDTQAPVIQLIGDATVNLTLGDVYAEQGTSVADNVDAGLVAAVSGTVDTDTAGTYTLTYTAQDTAGNVATATRTVTVAAIASGEEFYIFHSQHDDSAPVQYWGDTWGSGTTISDYTQDSSYDKVLQIDSGTEWGNMAAIAWGNEAENAIDISAYTHVKFKVKPTNLTDIEVIVQSPTDGESKIGYLISNGTPLADGWVEIEAALPGFSDMTWFALTFNNVEQSGSVLLADVHFVTQDVIVVGPDEAAPIPPQLSDQEALVLYSDSLKQDKFVSVWNSNWWNAPIYSQGDIDGNHYAKYEITDLGTEGGVVGLEFGVEYGAVDASEKTTFN